MHLTPPRPDPAPDFGGRIGWGHRPALLLIDMVAAYFTSGSPLHLPDHGCRSAAQQLLDRARTEAIPVLHTTVRYRAGMVDAGHFAAKVAALRVFAEDAAEPELAEIVPELRPRPHEPVIVKQYASAFFGSSLASTLTALSVDTLVIAGVSTSGCVRASVTDALQHGFRPMLAEAACGDRTSQIHRSNVRDLAAKYSDVVTVPECLERFAASSRALDLSGASEGSHS